MPKVRDILVHVNVETAERRRKCHRNEQQHAIAAGETCLVIKDPSTGGKKNYCKVCAREIIDTADRRLAAISAIFL